MTIPNFNQLLEKAQHEISFNKKDAAEFIRLVDELKKLRDAVYRHDGLLVGQEAADIAKYLGLIKDFAGRINVKKAK